MNNPLGRNTAAGFMPTTPAVQDMMAKLDGIMGKGFESLRNTEAGKPLAAAAESPADELKRRYARLFNGQGKEEDATAILEDLLDQTLRRGMFVVEQGRSIEDMMPFFLERHGQNGLMVYIAYMIQGGRDLPAPEARAFKRKRKKDNQ